MTKIRLSGIPLMLQPGDQVAAAPGDQVSPAEGVTFVVAEDGCGYADVPDDVAERLVIGYAEIDYAEPRPSVPPG